MCFAYRRRVKILRVARPKSWLVGRTGVWGLAFTAYKIWRSLPPEHRQRVVKGAKKHGPRVARGVANRVKRPPKPE
jgi:hypothetical protein